MTSQLDAMSIARTRIAEEAERHTGSLDLSDLGLEALPYELFALHHLRQLDLGISDPSRSPPIPRNRIDAQRERLGELTLLEVLSVAGSDLASLDPVRGLLHLRQLNCFRTQVSDLIPLAGLTALQQLNCSSTWVSHLRPLSRLSVLQQLSCSATRVSDLRPLLGLGTLQKLDCSGTQVSDLEPLMRLSTLLHLSFSSTPVTDLEPLSGLRMLQQVHCWNTQVADLGPLAGLSGLRQLYCWLTQVADLEPLRGLTALQQLSCWDTQVADLGPLSRLTDLQQLVFSKTQVADLRPLSGLSALRQLNYSETRVSDLGPLAGLPALQRLNCSSCRLHSLPASIRDKPSLRELVLFGSHVPGIPREVLSRGPIDNCLNAIRAHFADLAAEATTLSDVRILLLGNGRVGKTQIARWLSDKPFDESWNSTHGIQVTSTPFPGDAQTKLQIWDFGGQDIYHSTHALFLRSPAVLVVVWAAEEEKLGTHEHDGLTFRNYPLAYWVDLVRNQADADSPVLIVQSKCDRPEQEVLPFPVPDEALKELRYRKQLHVSAWKPRGRAALMESLSDAIAWLRDSSRLGDVQIGAGRLRVQRRLEALRDADMALPREQRRHRLLEQEAFATICEEEGGVTSPGLLLAYLDANGTVFYRPGLFGNRIVLDQGWAFEAIYAVFERTSTYQVLRRYRGRFTRSDLGRLIWKQQSEAEQKLLLSMMQSCGICFEHRRLPGPDGEDVEYIAPELLPERSEVTGSLAGLWDEDAYCEQALFRYALLHEGLMRGVMANIGKQAGPEPVYWRGGLCGYETTTRSRLLIAQEMTGSWQGAVRIRTQGGQATVLLQRVVDVVERMQAQLSMRPVTVERSSPVVEVRDEVPMAFGQEKPTMPQWYVSYAWGDTTPDGQAREKLVDDLCAEAEAQGQPILRDKEVLKLGDSISRFMQRIGKGDRVFVILSDKYLRSPHCMYELLEIWRNSRQDEEALLERVRIYTLGDADIWKPIGRAKYADYWKKEHDELAPYVLSLGTRDLAALRRMSQFYHHVGDILATFADIVQPRSFEDLKLYGFN